MRVALITNPRSRRNARGFEDVRAALRDRAPVPHHVLERFEALPALLSQLVRGGLDLLVVNGGDGTVQAVLSALLRGDGPIPLLALLPGGTTNAIAADVGLHGGRRRALGRLLDRAARSDLGDCLRQRDVIRVDSGDGRERFGMLFGAAGIARGIRFRRELLPQRWIPDALGNAVALTALACGWSVGGRDARLVFAGDRIGVTIDGRDRGAGRFALVLVTTLDRVVLGARPFWGSGAGSLRYTGIAAPPPALLRHLPALLYGGRQRRLPYGYQSVNADSITLAMDCPFVLDGEFHEPASGRPLLLGGGNPVRFVCG